MGRKSCCSAALHTAYQLFWNQQIISHSRSLARIELSRSLACSPSLFSLFQTQTHTRTPNKHTHTQSTHERIFAVSLLQWNHYTARLKRDTTGTEIASWPIDGLQKWDVTLDYWWFGLPCIPPLHLQSRSLFETHIFKGDVMEEWLRCRKSHSSEKTVLKEIMFCKPALSDLFSRDGLQCPDSCLMEKTHLEYSSSHKYKSLIIIHQNGREPRAMVTWLKKKRKKRTPMAFGDGMTGGWRERMGIWGVEHLSPWCLWCDYTQQDSESSLGEPDYSGSELRLSGSVCVT